LSQNGNGLLEYIPGSQTLLVQKNSSLPLEGFAENVQVSIQEYAENSKSDVEKGNNFLQWVLTRVFEATEDDAADAIVDGANDLGIDAYLPVDFSDNTIRLFQSKYGTSHSLEAIAKFKEDVKRLLVKDVTKMRPELAQLVTKIKEKNLKIKCCYVTDQRVEYEDEFVEVIDGKEIIQKLWDRIKKPAAGKKSSIKLERMLKHEHTILGILKLRELTEFVSKNRDYVFESNIRQWMQFKTTVNKGIRETLQSNPGKFFYYNNGITIVVSDFVELGENLIELYAPQIVNGAQTSNSILDHSKRTKNMEGHDLLAIASRDSVNAWQRGPDKLACNTTVFFFGSEGALVWGMRSAYPSGAAASCKQPSTLLCCRGTSPSRGEAEDLTWVLPLAVRDATARLNMSSSRRGSWGGLGGGGAN